MARRVSSFHKFADDFCRTPLTTPSSTRARIRALFTWTTFAAPFVLFVLLLAQRFELSAPASLAAIAGYAGMLSSLVYLRYVQALEHATWIFLLGALFSLGGSAALSPDGYMVSLIFLAVTPVKFGLILNWRQCLKFTIVLVGFYIALASWAIGAGGADYMQGMYLATFGMAAMGAGLSTTAYAYRTKRASQHLQRKNDEIARLALEDPLTGLLNRRAFNALNQDGPQAQAFRLLAMIDLDNFKSINDQFGHEVGDEVLHELARRLADSRRTGDRVYRLGGDEFVVVCDAAQMKPEPFGAVICAATAAAFETSAGMIQLNVSVGIAEATDDNADLNQMFRDADIAVFEAKQCEGSAWVVYNNDLRPKHERADKLSKLLRTAIETADLDVVFQPQFQIDTKAIIGFEALARWQTDELGPISPAEFIQIAETSNLIVQLDRIVFQKAIQLSQDWLFEEQVLSINVSGPTLLSPDFLDFIERKIVASDLSFDQIQLEITETQILANKDQAIAVCDALRNLGVSIALDDFGTGYSSLSYLSNLPVNVLKIDRSFVQGCDRESNQKIMRSIVGLARSLGLCVMIEGVERDWQLKIARELGCNFVQGFYFSRPLSHDNCAEANQAAPRPNPVAASGRDVGQISQTL